MQTAGSRSYKGTLDLTKVAGVTGIDKVTVDSYGAAAQNVPFTAGLDEQGRLSALTIELPAVNGTPTQPLEVLYTDYGIAVTAEAPPAARDRRGAGEPLHHARRQVTQTGVRRAAQSVLSGRGAGRFSSIQASIFAHQS